MKHSYWISYQFHLPDGRSGFGAGDIVTDAPLQAEDMGGVMNWVRRTTHQPNASVVVLAISKFEQS